ncbi:MAG TPA: hypothetical protein VFC19_04310 [Candidatus Limnocylindrales bacterium]|nr:hypothetical protein [Candidatus Limnocylindrales bacterium]
MKLRRLVTLASLAVVTSAASVFGVASSASAVPTNCTLTYGSNWAQSICTAGTGEHQVAMLQQHFIPGNPILCVGNWAPVGQVSYTPCANHTIVNVWINKRG